MENFTIASNECSATNSSRPALAEGEGQEWPNRWFPIILVSLGLLANTAFLFVVYRHKSMRNTTNIYLANLAVADNMLLMFGGVAVAINATSHLPTPAMACVYQVAIATPLYASMSLVTMVTLDRFYAICRPFKHRAMKGKARAIKLSASTWVFGLIYGLMSNSQSIILGAGCRVLQPGDKLVNAAGLNIDCSDPDDTQQQSRAPLHDDALKTLPFLTLLTTNIILYSRIIHSLWKSAQRRSQLNQQTTPGWARNITKSRIRITRMLAVTTLVFFISIFPRSAVVVVRYIQSILGMEPSKFLDAGIVTIVSSTLMMVNSCVNPLIYILTNAKYKQAFREVFLSGCNRADRDSQTGAAFRVPVPVPR